MKILVIDDDKTIQLMIKSVLKKNGYDVTSVELGKEGRELAAEESFDCIILDMRLPDMDGMEVLKYLRDHKILTPLLILSARDGVESKVKGLHSGADDYLTKPFDFNELLARIEAITRRTIDKVEGQSEIYKAGELWINLLQREFKIGQHKVFLTNNEFNLMTYFLQHPDRVISKEELSNNVWGIDFDTQTNFVNVYISYLRKKIRDYTSKEYIETIRGEGFRLNSDPDNI